MSVRKRITSGNRGTFQKNTLSRSSQKLMRTCTLRGDVEGLRQEIKQIEEAALRQWREIEK